jgi:hypothetical protein
MFIPEWIVGVVGTLVVELIVIILYGLFKKD